MALTIEYWPVEKVIPYDKNPRDNSKAVDKVAESLKEYGWQQPIVVDNNGVIIVGHTRLKAAKSLGMDSVPVVVARGLTPEQAKAYRLADNKTADFSIWDNKLLLGELEELQNLDLFTGFNFSEVFDHTLDENDIDAILNNNEGVYYEVSFKSENKDLIEKMVEHWEREHSEDSTDAE